MVRKFVVCLAILVTTVGATTAYPQIPEATKFWAWNQVDEDEFITSEYRLYPVRLKAEGTHCAVYAAIDTVTVTDMTINPVTNNIFAVCAWQDVQAYNRSDLYVSGDVGESWASTGPDVLSLPYTAVASHEISATRGIIAVTAICAGAFYSQNDGARWSNKNARLVELAADMNFRDVAIAPLAMSSSYRVYIVSDEVFSKGSRPPDTWQTLDTTRTAFEELLNCIAAFDYDNIFVGNPTGVYKWDEATTSWIEKSDVGANALVFDPTDANILYAGTESGVYKSTNNGDSWSQTSLTESITSISVNNANTSIVLAGTPGNGVYKSTDGGSSWTQLIGGLDLTGVGHPDYASNVLSVLAVSPDTAIAGTRNGVFRLDGAEPWNWKNTGILPDTVESAIIDTVIDDFENTIYGIKDVFGEPSDIDSTGKIILLLAELSVEVDPVPDPNVVIGDGPAPRAYDRVDQFPERDTAHSNRAEVLYLDTPSPLSSVNMHGIAKGFSAMCHYNADPDEVTWLVRAGEGFAEYLVFVGEGNEDLTAIEFPQKTAGLAVANADITYLWIMYLYEKYGGLAKIKNLIASTLQDFESIDSIFEINHTDVFKDFVVACYLDNPDYNTKYGFNKLTVSMKPTGGLPIEASKPLTWWGASAYLFTPGLGNTIFFNAENTNKYALPYVKMSGTSITAVGEIELDTVYQEAKIDVSDITGDMALVLIPTVIGRTGIAPAYIINNDVTPPAYVKTGLFQNPMESRFLQTFVFTNERLYSDVYVEKPRVSVILATHLTDTIITDTFDVAQEIFDEPGTDSILVIYNGPYELTDTGAATIETWAEDYWGNDILISKEVAIQKISPNTGGTIASTDKHLKVLIPAHSLSSDTYFITYAIDSDDCIALPTLSNRTPVSSAYKVGPSGLTLNKDAVLTMHYDEDTQASLAIYRLEDNDWVYVGGEVNILNKSVSTTISKFGIYQVQAGSYHGITPQLPESYALYRSTPNPANTDISIMYAIPKGTDVSIKVYNISGQMIKTIVEGYQEAGYRSITWKLNDDSGNAIKSGVYFVSMNTGNFTATRKLVILK